LTLFLTRVPQLETVIGKETTAYQTKLEQLENKSIKCEPASLHATAAIACTAF
jgi:hypothetical protein